MRAFGSCKSTSIWTANGYAWTNGLKILQRLRRRYIDTKSHEATGVKKGRSANRSIFWSGTVRGASVFEQAGFGALAGE